jgi:hypothetical protein
MNRMPKILLVLFAVALLVTLTTPALTGEMTAGDMKGKIMSVDANNLGFQLKTDESKGRILNFVLDEDASILINNVDSQLTDLKKGDTVSIVHRQEGDTWYAIEVRCERK